MQRWKERGYVPDSDEDEDLSSISKSQHSTRSRDDNASRPTNFKDLNTSQSSELPIAHNGTSEHHAAKAVRINSDSESSLSFHDSLDESPVPEQTRNTAPRASDKSKNSTTNVDRAPQEVISVEEDADLVAFRTGRELRKRNPIQVHPYKLEIEKYRQTLRARGVRPVNVVIETQLDSSSEAEDGSSQVLPSSSPFPPARRVENDPPEQDQPSTRLTSPRFRLPPIASRLSDNEDDELPDVKTLLQNPGHRVVKIGAKRRKVTRADSNGARHQHPVADQSSTVDGSTSFSPMADVFDIPPSPDTSPSSPLDTGFSVKEARFRMPAGFSATALPTPVNSSGDRVHAKNVSIKVIQGDIESDSEHAVSSHRSRRQAVVLSDDDEASDDSSEGSSQGSLDRMRRRIKGVLPASWLKLDLQAQGKSHPQQKQHHGHLAHHEAGRGVAHKRNRSDTTSHPASPTMDNPIAIFDNELGSSGGEGQQSVRPLSPPQKKQRLIDIHDNQFRFVRNDDDPGVGMEEDMIDRMFATSASNRRPAKKTGKRQIRLKDAFFQQQQKQPILTYQKASFSEAQQTSQKSRQKLSKGHRHAVPGKPRRKSAPKLSVVDAISPSNASTDVPQFLRVANRQVQKRSDQGRHSPTRKQIRLATLQDTDDAASVLRDWREGTIQPRDAGRSTSIVSRPALGELSTNLQQRLLSPHPISETQSKKTKPFGKATKHVQTSLLPLVTRIERSESPSITQNERQQPTGGKQSRTTLNPRFNVRQFRDAQLEAPESKFEWTDRQAAFQNHLRRTGSDVLKTTINGPPSAVTLNTHSSIHHLDSYTSIDHTLRTPRQPTKKLRRKNKPRRLDVETKEYRQPELPIISDRADEPQAIEMADSDEKVLTGLGPYGTCYTADFDIRLLEHGTYFHESTFIGSGDFERALRMNHRDFDVNAGSHKIILCKTHCTWSPWDETMANEIHLVFQKMEKILKSYQSLGCQLLPDSLSTLAPTLQDIIANNSKWLSFIDPVDRSAFSSRCRQDLTSLFESTLDLLPTISSEEHGRKVARELLRFLTRQLSLVAQLLAILKQTGGSSDLMSDIQQLALIVARSIVFQVTKAGFPKIREFLEDNRHHLIREAGIRSDQVEVEAVLVVRHVLDSIGLPENTLWSSLNAELSSFAKRTNNVAQFEKLWQNVFTLLPVLEIDVGGVLRAGMRLRQSPDNWELIKVILTQIFELYHTTPTTSSSTINEYIRALLSRCHVLVSTWGWRRCEPIISTIFDFFAKHALAPLRNEHINGSPKFLEQLHLRPSLQLFPEDKAFHVFLKLMTLGLFQMREIYSHKKIRSIAWRWIPNHGRTHRKDEALKQEDLDALRNHHDLLCVLYWASPSGFRPRVDLIQNLVDHASSHREACRLSVRAWSNLVKFQISTSEPEANLQPFASWFRDILHQSIGLYRTARTEAEGQFEAANKNGDRLISTQRLERTIGQNQQQVLATIADALNGMKSAMSQSSCPEHAITLLRSSELAKVFRLFDSKNPRLCTVMIEVLHVYQAFINLLERKQLSEPQNSSEESQDYGEWPEFDEAANPSRSSPSIEFVSDPLADFVSNVFGAETSPEEGLLIKAVETWTQIAKYEVRQSMRDWSSFLDPYSRHSWSQLRDTEQRRKFTPLFYSSVIFADIQAFLDNRQAVTSAWLVSLADRESLLKFQHKLTTAMLNLDADDQLLFNMPFTKAAKSQKYDVSLADLRQRRLGIISTILSNMQRSFYNTMATSPGKTNQVRREYSEYLKQLMSAMKANYQELGDGDTVRGAYVEFVQAVVESLQQYTADICSIDKFFTDSAAFPLPAKDPTYVVGRLKGYMVKLSDPKTVKQLSAFIQNMSERAISDDQQSYLVEQLKTAIASQRERGDPARPTLRAVLTQVIFPAYISLSLRTTTGWILAEPILEVSRAAFDDLLYHFSISQRSAVQSVLQSVNAILHAIQQSMDLLIVHSGLFEQPYILRTLRLMFDTVRSSLDSLDYIRRATGEGKGGARLIRWFKSFSIFALEMILDTENAQAPNFDEEPTAPKLLYPEIKDFCERELNQELSSRWTRVGETCYLHRGNSRRELRGYLGSMEGEKSRLVAAIEELQMTLERFPSFED